MLSFGNGQPDAFF
jgi:hypothetical protein